MFVSTGKLELEPISPVHVQTARDASIESELTFTLVAKIVRLLLHQENETVSARLLQMEENGLTFNRILHACIYQYRSELGLSVLLESSRVRSNE